MYHDNNCCNPETPTPCWTKPISFLDKYFTPLTCAWQQPDYRPLFFSQDTRFSTKENYGPQIQFVDCATLNPPPYPFDPRKYDFCLNKAGAPATHVVPDPVVAIMLMDGDSPSFRRNLLGILSAVHVDKVHVIYTAPGLDVSLARILSTPPYYQWATKAVPYFAGSLGEYGVTKQNALQSYQQRFLAGKQVILVLP